MKILITGATGQLGQSLAQVAVAEGHEVILLSRADCDLSEPEQIAQHFNSETPDLVVNAAAYTAVDKAESDEEQAFLVNAKAVAVLAALCQEFRCPLIHVSTDYVFDGISSRPYQPAELTNPKSVYGASKLAGELAVRQYCPSSIIIRTSWVFSEHGNNFVKTMRRLMCEREQLSVVDDQIGRPTYAADLAAFICHAVKLIGQGWQQWGTYHFANSETLSWYQFALLIKADLQITGTPVKTQIRPISTIEYPTPARRPAYSVLDCNATEQAFAYPMPALAPALLKVAKLLHDQ